MRLLIIDDDESFRAALARACERRGCVVTVASDRASALGRALEFGPDAAVVDLRLADASGLALLPELLAIRPAMRLLMLTGFSSIATAVEAVKRGAINYLAKPAAVDDILRALGHGEAPLPVSTPAAAPEPSIDRLTWEYIQRILLEERGNISAAARRLGMHRRTLQRRLSKRPVAH
ncbi:two-component system response regulator RegA [Paraperlucidibaca baekdonensis]|uniref:Two-component system response regulator RegA n=1 Tax=Paraperlucidibaca baekdonensis TaxID=748120 RepID=A0A3E0H2Q4_9GAMM|nr:response regulator [Paraperlucidibaca baekdonensis]REH36789.1 two-component system response regulator RegA [Paraperlucidibaca baekdonensis]